MARASDSVPHGLTGYTDPLGRLQLKTEYDAEGRVIRQTDADGKAVNITTDTTNNRQTIRDRRGNTTVYDFDALGRKTVRAHDAYGNVTQETDPLGRTATTAYNAKGEVTQTLDENGRKTVNGYDQTGDLTRITDHAGAAINLGYVPATGSLSSIRDALGNQTRYSYAKINGTNLKQSETAPDGAVTTYGYDGAGNVTSTQRQTVLKPGAATTNTTTAQTFDAQGNVLTSTDAQGNTTRYTYNAARELLTETDALNRLTKHEYSARGERTKTTHPDGGVETWTFDADGNETQHCLRNVCTRQEYDALGRVTKSIDALGNSATTVYDAAGQVSSTTDAKGNFTRFQYDAAGRQTIVTDALSQAAEQSYDAAGNVAQDKNAAGQITTYGHDLMGRRTSVTLPNGSTMTYGFNALGQRISETDATGHTATYAYDAMGRLASVTDPLGKATGYGRNSLGQLLTQTDALGRVTAYGYDSAGRRVERKLPGGAIEKLTHDATGQLVSRVDFDGTTASYEYDAAGRLAKVHRADGTQTLAYESRGYANNWTDTQDGSLGRSYNAAGQVTSESTSHNVNFGAGTTGLNTTVAYQWDANGNRTQVSSDGKTTKATYDALNRLTNLIDPVGGATTVVYDAAGNKTQATRPDGSTTEYQYDAANQITGVRHRKADGNVLAQFDYTLDAAGRRTQAIEVINAASPVRRTVSYAYDATGKLLSEAIAQTQPSTLNLTIAYEHDAVGNRTKRTVTGDQTRTTAYEYDANDRLTKATDSVDGVTTYAWDARGNLTSKTNGGNTTTYTWRSDNRLLSIDDGSQKIHYGYNANGQRIKRYVVKGGTATRTHYALDTQRPYNEVLIEYTQVGTAPWTNQSNVFTPDGVGELLQSGNHATFTDVQGNTRLVIDPAGNATALSYDAFGLELSNATMSVSHRYTGEYFDQDSGLYHLRARDYDPSIGHFISMDEHPMKFSGFLYPNDFLIYKRAPYWSRFGEVISFDEWMLLKLRTEYLYSKYDA